jgi:phosphoglycolate phosphatase-like HAD superfamily hydrolase
VKGVALFDIDGTLTATNEIDRDCFLAAFLQEFGIAEIDADWSGYEQTTDRGITAEILRRASRPENEEELARHRRRFVELLRTCAEQIRPIAGAAAFLDRVGRAGWEVAIVTGAWSDSARVKLEAVGLGGRDIVSCDQLVARADILRCALDSRHPAVLFGDALWDLRAAQEVGIDFIGIGDKTQRLVDAGAHDVFTDYRDGEAILDAMERCAH